MRFTLAQIGLVLGILLTLSGSGQSQQGTGADKRTQMREQRSPTPDEYREQLTVIRSLMSGRDYATAAALLEVLYTRNKQDATVGNLLYSCYTLTEAYAKAELLMRHFVADNPNNQQYLLFLAESLARQGKETAADSAYDRAFASAAVLSDPVASERVLSSMLMFSNVSRPAALIDSVRKATGDPTLYPIERGLLYFKEGKYEQAAAEYLPLVGKENDPRALNASTQLNGMLALDSSAKTTEKYLISISRQKKSWQAPRILALHFLKQHRLNEAFEFVLIDDSLSGGTGRSLYPYLEACLARRQFSEAARTATHLLEAFPEARERVQTVFGLATALAGLGKLDSAIALYAEIATTSPNVRDRIDARFRIGDLYLNNDNPESALAEFDSLLVFTKGSPREFRTQLLRGKSLLRLGKFAEAKTAFDSVGESGVAESEIREDVDPADLNASGLPIIGGTIELPGGGFVLTPQIRGAPRSAGIATEIHEEILYYRGFTRLLLSELDSARLLLKAIPVRYPSGLFVNDALTLELIVGDVADNPDLLDRYVDVLSFQTTRQDDSANAVLISLRSHVDQRLADVATYKLAEGALNRQDTTFALSILEEGLASFAESSYRPYMLKLAGDLYGERALYYEKAANCYRELLEKYPHHPLAPDTRKRMKELRDAA